MLKLHAADFVHVYANNKGTRYSSSSTRGLSPVRPSPAAKTIDDAVDYSEECLDVIETPEPGHNPAIVPFLKKKTKTKGKLLV